MRVERLINECWSSVFSWRCFNNYLFQKRYKRNFHFYISYFINCNLLYLQYIKDSLKQSHPPEHKSGGGRPERFVKTALSSL
nr:MAG TPA: hypothetical protein [Inoviridae sp.]